jgi:phosphonate transport system substrate-binding protein
MKIRGLIRVIALAAAGLATPAPADENIEFGILPTLNTRTILATYQPLREHLEANLKRPVTMVTAADYRAFVERTQRRDFRFVLTAPHFARLAQVEAGYVPMLRIQRELRGILVVRDDSPIRSIGDLRGKSVATPEDIALITMLATDLLRQKGLKPAQDFMLRQTTSFATAMLAVENGEHDAAVSAPTALNQMPESTRKALRVIGETRAVPHMIYLAHPGVPAAERERMVQAMLAFVADKERSGAFFEKTGFGGFVPVTEAELASLDGYRKEIHRLLKVKPRATRP